MNMTCEQFETLMHFYIDDDLKEELRKAFEYHMQTCKSCRQKYNTFKKIIFDLRDTFKQLSAYPSFAAIKTAEQNNLNTHISAYIDNELDIEENIKVKKMIISKPDVRDKIEKIYTLKQLLKNSFDKTNPKQDFSKKIVRKIYFDEKYKYNKDILYSILSFVILCVVWVVMLVFSI